MDDTTKSIIDRIIVRYQKPKPVPGGHECSVFYDCAQLSPNDLARLAAAATGHLDHAAFHIAVGIAYNGIFFASAVAGGRQVAILQKDGVVSGPSVKGKKVLLVSDVVCTGSEIKKAEDKILAAGGNVVGYAAIIDRSDGKFGTDKKPFWSAYRTSLE